MESQQTTENTNKKVIAMDEKDLSDHEDDLHRKRKKKSKDRDKKSKDKDKYKEEKRRKKDYHERSPEKYERNDRKYKETEESTEPLGRIDRRHRSSSRHDTSSHRRSSERNRPRESRDRYHRRSTSRSDSRRRPKSYRRSPSRDGDKVQRSRKEIGKEDASFQTKPIGNPSDNNNKPITLKDVMSANPGITLPEAVVKLNAHNSALARGEQPPPIANPHSLSSVLSSILPSGLPLTAAGNLGSMPDALTKPHRELYVGNLPPGITVPQLAEFLNSAMKQLGLAKDLSSVITAWVSPDGHYAFVELRSVEEATAALTYLNGVQVGVYSLKIGRPKGYNGGSSSILVPMQASATAPTTGPLGLAGLANGISTNPLLSTTSLSSFNNSMSSEPLSNVIMVSNLPALISEDQIKELFTPFGELKAFNIIKTVGESQSAVFEYVDPDISDGVVSGLNKLDIAGSRLSVQRIPQSSASLLLKPSSLSPPRTSDSAVVNIPSNIQSAPSPVVQLHNMTTIEDLVDEQLYEELVEDIYEECSLYGSVKSVLIPRDKSLFDSSFIGTVFVHLGDVDGAKKVFKAVSGRKFNGRIVEACYYPEELFIDDVARKLGDARYAICSINNINADLD